MPVSSDARLAALIGVVTKALRKQTPSRASESMCGVRTIGLRYPTASHRWSSVRMKRMLGLSRIHIYFYRVQEGKPVAISIPVRLTGNAEGVKVGGKLVLSTRKIFVSGPVDKLPDAITVDVTTLGVGKTIFVGDLKSDDLKFLTPATTAVCAVRVTRASRGAAAEALSLIHI